ncbi:hypothetical protein IJT10_06150, partial [bacterium]|nr:hypothetical protein [bacterium]
MNTFVFDLLSVTDWSTGHPLLNGNSASHCLMLGAKFNPFGDFDAGVEFSAYSSNGNNLMSAFWGVPQPYWSNPVMANVGYNTNGNFDNSHKFYTKLALDNFWIKKRDGSFNLVFGSFKEDNFDSLVFTHQRNANAWDDYYAGCYGLLINGQIPINESSHLRWEAMATNLANNASSPDIAPEYYYETRAQGLNLEWLFNDENGSLKASFMHTADEGNDGTPRQGLLSSANYSLGWVNPDGYYVNQIGMGTSQVAGIGSTSDIRPISMVGAVGNDGYTGIAGVPNLGGIGPQDMRTYSLSGRYTFEINDDIKPTIFAEYAHSEYKPSKNSDYSVGGDALRAGMQFSLFNDKLNLEGSYNRVDPTYDPYILVYPTAELGNTLWSVPNFTYYSNFYSLHDTENYTHNRKGFRTKLAWKFCPTGQLQLSYSKLSQTRTSCQDVRYSAGSLGPFTPNSTVLGFSPGFIDPVFGGFAEETFASDGTNALGKVLENPRGHVENWVVGFGFKYPLNIKKDRRCIGLYGGARSTHFKRSSDLVNILNTPTRWGAQSQNYIDCYFNGWQIRADYDITTKLKINVNYKVADIFGHMDHLGVMNAYADAIHSTDFDILNVQQFIPSVGLDWQMSDQLTWGIMGQFYRTKDSMSEDIYATPAVPAVNIALPPQHGSHPFNWQGYMVSSHIDYKF